MLKQIKNLGLVLVIGTTMLTTIGCEETTTEIENYEPATTQEEVKEEKEEQKQEEEVVVEEKPEVKEEERETTEYEKEVAKNYSKAIEEEQKRKEEAINKVEKYREQMETAAIECANEINNEEGPIEYTDEEDKEGVLLHTFMYKSNCQDIIWNITENDELARDEISALEQIYQEAFDEAIEMKLVEEYKVTPGMPTIVECPNCGEQLYEGDECQACK